MKNKVRIQKKKKNMKKFSSIIIPLLAGSLAVSAQEKSSSAPLLQNTAERNRITTEGRMPAFADWDANPKMHPVPPQYNNEHALYILESEKRDFKFEGSGITMYSTIHRIIKVLDRLGIEEFNQVVVPFRMNESRVDSVKARTILPDGTTRELKYEMLLGGSGGFFFALDGLEKNAEVEIVIKYKALSDYFGSIRYQYGVPILNAYFELNYPKEMTFNTKGYHGFPSGEEKTVGGHKQVKIYQADIPALQDQPSSFYDLYAMRIEYGLDHMTGRGGFNKGEPYTWDYLAHHNYQEFYTLKESEKNTTAKFLSTLGLIGGETEEQKIKKIEDGIKTNIVQYWELQGKEAEDIDSIVTKKSASAHGMVKLFAACLKMAGVQHELGVTSNRTEHQMDAKFVNWAPLDYYVFYFPKHGGYLAPDEPYFRYPEVPAFMVNNKGVFCKTNPETEFTVGREVTEAEAIIRTIEPKSAAYTQINTKAWVALDNEFDATVDYKRTYSGYSAPELRKELAIATPEAKKKIILNEALIAKNPEMLVKYSVSNEAFSAVYNNKPLEIDATVKSNHLVEKAGDNYLLKIGSLIGSQDNFYTKQERILPIDIKYPHTLNFTITIKIPEGYKLLNTDALRIHEEHNDRNTGNTTAYFKSDYRIDGRTLVVTATESYPVLHYSVSEYPSFKRVVNAVADFNKVVVLMEPEKQKPGKKAKPHTAKAITAAAVTKKK